MQFLFVALVASLAGHYTVAAAMDSSEALLLSSPSPAPTSAVATPSPDPTMAGDDGLFSWASVQVAIKDATTDVKNAIYSSAQVDKDADKAKDDAAIAAIHADMRVKMSVLTKDMVALEVEIQKAKSNFDKAVMAHKKTLEKLKKMLAEKKAEYKKDRKITLDTLAQIDSVTKAKQERLRQQLQNVKDELKTTKELDAAAAADMEKAQRDLVTVVAAKKAAIEAATQKAKMRIDADLQASKIKEQALKDKLQLLLDEIDVKKSESKQWLDMEMADKKALVAVLADKNKAMAKKKTAGTDAYILVADKLKHNTEEINKLEDDLKKILYQLTDGKAYIKTTNCTLPKALA